MAALEPNYMTILRRVLAERFVPSLPPLLDTRKPPVEQTAKQLSRAFSAFALNKILGLAPHVAAKAVVDDFQDRGIDAIYYDPRNETLYLLQTKLKETEQFKQEDALAFCEGVRLLLRMDYPVFNENVQSRKEELDSALDSCSHIQLVAPFTGDGISQSALNVMRALINDEELDEERFAKEVMLYTAEDIVRDLLAENAYQPVNAEIFLKSCEKIEEPRTTYYGVTRLRDLISLHEESGKALYERNIRYFLGSGKSDVNKAIKNTLRESPADFFYLNNGITAVCDVIEPKVTRHGIKKIKVRGLSIINGAQTVAAAAEFSRQNPEVNIEDARVMLTLIKASSDGAFGKNVTKARNHQNQVQAANFASLDEVQERLRQELAFHSFDYHYRPESASNTGAPSSITLDEALRALALLKNDPRFPAWLKNEPARLANPEAKEYQSLFVNDLSGIALINAVMCYREIRLIMLGNEQRARGQERLVYRHGIHVVTSVMLKSLRDRVNGNQVLDRQVVAGIINRPLDQLRQDTYDLAVNSMQVGPLAFFRNQGRVISFAAELMEKSFALGADPAVIALRNVHHGNDEYPRKRLIEYLSNHAPQY